MAIVISIGGVSNAGKTTLAARLREILTGLDVEIIHQDDYIVPTEMIPKVKDRIDWEDPASIDINRFRNAITEAAYRNDVVIAEGFLVYYYPELLDLYDRMIFIEIPKEVFIERKILDRRWGWEPAWYLDHIWKSYLKYGTLNTDNPELLHLRGDMEFPLKRILESLETYKFSYALKEEPGNN